MIKQGISAIPVTRISNLTIEGYQAGKEAKEMMTKNQQSLGIISKTDIVKALTKLA
jgi:hypothetical protein